MHEEIHRRSFRLVSLRRWKLSKSAGPTAESYANADVTGFIRLKWAKALRKSTDFAAEAASRRVFASLGIFS